MVAPISDWDGTLDPLDFLLVALVVGLRDAGNIRVGQVQLGAGVAAALRGIAEATARNVAEMPQLPWTAETAWERGEVRRIQLRQLDDDNPVTGALAQREFDDLAIDELRSQSLLFYAIVTGSQPGDRLPDERRFFLRKSNPRLAANRRIVTLLSGQELTRITQPLFTFDRSTDLIFVPGQGLLALNESPFDILFRDTPELLARTPEHARRLAACLPLTEGSAEVLERAAVRYARVRRRVLAASDRGHLTSVTPVELRAELRRQSLDPRIHMPHGRLAITDESVLEIIRVLNEDLLTGGLSGQRFEVERKSALT